ncbi:MAG: lipoprotein insertase outer membrane protein LolB [Steroidobacteraceae bacterium]
MSPEVSPRARPARTLAALGALLALALSACQTVPVPPAPITAWHVRRPLLQAQQRFTLDGRVAVAVGTQGFDADLRWVQRGADTRVVLSGPFGAGATQVSDRAGELGVITSHGRHLGNTAARAALERELGFDPPLRTLRYWILGVPDPSKPARITLDATQRLAHLQQAGWSVDYLAYNSVGAEWLPRLLTVRRGAVRLRMVVDAWHLQ